MSYSENLVIPNTQRYSAVETQPLYGVVTAALSDETRTSNGTDYELVDIVNEAEMIAGYVRKAMHFTPAWTHHNLLNKETIAQQQTSDCLGYALVLSELLENQGIPHYVGYINDLHAYIALSNSSLTDFYFLDPEDPKLSGNMTKHMDQRDILSASRLYDAHGKFAVRFNVRDFANTELDPQHSYDALKQRTESRPDWISRRNLPFEASLTKVFVDDETKEAQLIANFIAAEPGRETIVKHANLNFALKHGDIDFAAQLLIQEGNFYPESDLRLNHTRVKRVIRTLSLGNSAEGPAMAAQVATSVGSALALYGDARAHLWKADRLTGISARSGDVQYVQSAVELYELALGGLRYTANAERSWLRARTVMSRLS